MTFGEPIDFDRDMVPPAVRPVVVLTGSMHQMGVQYGRQAKDMIARNAAVIASEVFPMWGNWDEIRQEMDRYGAIIAEGAPGVTEMWLGMADGADLDYYDILMINLSLPLFIMAPPGHVKKQRQAACSNFSAWGSKTRGGTLYASANLDQGWNKGTHTAVVVAFPENGIPFISVPPWAGELIGNASLNGEGVVMLGSAGQDRRAEDRAISVPNMTAKLMPLMHSRTVDEAIEHYLTLHPSNAENAHFADEGDAKLVEYTPAHHVVRSAGDHDEEDFLIATNHFISDEMQSSIVQGELNNGWYDAWPRYDTYFKLLNDATTPMDRNDIAGVLACHDYWDGEAWQRDVYDTEPLEDARSCWSPEMRAPDSKTLMKSIMIPAERTAYLMNGAADRRMSTLPDATGQYAKLVLGDSVSAVLDSAISDAEQFIWEAGRALNTAGNVAAIQDERFEESRRELWRAFNSRAAAILAMNSDDSAQLYGEALTRLCRAQTLAKQSMV